MSANKILKSIIGWAATAVVVVVCVISVRRYVIESYRVSTPSMETTLRTGDYILADKLIRNGNPGRNRTVLFTSPLKKDSVLPPIFISRCIGMPGDTLLVDDSGYKINGRSIPYSPTALKNYFVSVQSIPQFYAIIKELNIPVRNLKNEPYGKILSLTELEEKSIRERLSADANKQFVREQIVPYQLIIPKKGKAYRITEASLIAGEEAMLSQIGEGAEIKDRKLFVDGKRTDFVFFDEDYYWMLSDNANEAIDSRHLGFVPESSIIGNVFFVWYSRDKDRRFKKVN